MSQKNVCCVCTYSAQGRAGGSTTSARIGCGGQRLIVVIKISFLICTEFILFIFNLCHDFYVQIKLMLLKTDENIQIFFPIIGKFLSVIGRGVFPITH